MKLFKIERPDNCDYEEYDSAVVAARDEASAKLINPNEGYVWVPECDKWFCGDRLQHEAYRHGGWVHPDKVIVTKIGNAVPGTKPGVIVASFNAG